MIGYKYGCLRKFDVIIVMILVILLVLNVGNEGMTHNSYSW